MQHPILLDESAFDETFIPERLVSRENQIREIAKCLEPARDGRTIKNIYIFGPPGVGKTIVTRWILKENFHKKSAYVNCWSKRTPHKIMEEVLLQTGHVVHGKEPTSDLIKTLEKSQKRFIICLDEADHIENADILYDLAKNSLGLVLISNQQFCYSGIDGRISGRIFLSEIEFRSYQRDEIVQILKERVLYGLVPDSISENLLFMVSGMSNGDARIALQIVKVSAKDAESKDLETITIEEIKEAAKCARKYRLSYLLGKLNAHQRTIYDILKRCRTMDSGELFEEYRKKSKENLLDRTYRNYMQRMRELGLIRESGSGRWKKYEIVF